MRPRHSCHRCGRRAPLYWSGACRTRDAWPLCPWTLLCGRGTDGQPGSEPSNRGMARRGRRHLREGLGKQRQARPKRQRRPPCKDRQEQARSCPGRAVSAQDGATAGGPRGPGVRGCGLGRVQHGARSGLIPNAVANAAELNRGAHALCASRCACHTVPGCSASVRTDLRGRGPEAGEVSRLALYCKGTTGHPGPVANVTSLSISFLIYQIKT